MKEICLHATCPECGGYMASDKIPLKDIEGPFSFYWASLKCPDCGRRVIVNIEPS